jgi:hypothetical protein
MARSMGRTDGYTISSREVVINAITGGVKLYRVGYCYRASSDGGIRGGLETVGPVCATG